jgi:hypothetical protein
MTKMTALIGFARTQGSRYAGDVADAFPRS